MKERPIMFNAAMVRAVLDGRKSQTRRVVKAPKWSTPGYAGVDFPCPYGAPGDRLWVRECFHAYSLKEVGSPLGQLTTNVVYRADPTSDEYWAVKWRPSIYMPRWASRITLEVTGVRVERVQDIGELDAEREGTPNFNQSPSGVSVSDFIHLWDSINGKRNGGVYSWDSNPWVWVVEFRGVDA